MEVIVSAIGALGSSIINLIASSKEAKYGRLPDWMTPKDFQREDYTMEIILGGIGLALLAIIITIAIVTVKKSK